MSAMAIYRQQRAYAYTVRRRMRCTNSLFASLYPSRSLPNLLASCRFKKSIGIRICCVCSKVIPERDMPVIFKTAQRAHIEVMLYIGTVRPEGLPPADAQIASVLVSQVG